MHHSNLGNVRNSGKNKGDPTWKAFAQEGSNLKTYKHRGYEAHMGSTSVTHKKKRDLSLGVLYDAVV